MADVSYMSSLPSDDRQRYIEKNKDLGDIGEVGKRPHPVAYRRGGQHRHSSSPTAYIH